MSSSAKKFSNFKKNKTNYSVKSVTYTLNVSENTENFDEWKLYFTDEEFQKESETHNNVVAFKNYLNRNLELFPIDTVIENRYFNVDLKKIGEDQIFRREWKSFDEDLNKKCEYTLNCMSFAMVKIIQKSMKEITFNTTSEEHQDIPIVKARILHHEPIILLKNLKVKFYGKLVSFRGTVIKLSNVKLRCEWIAFQCKPCGGIQVVRQTDGNYCNPSRCSSRGCKSQSNFIPMLSSPHTRTVSWQSLKLQEVIGAEQSEGGRIPRTVGCELSNDLVNSCVPGDDITLTGVIKVRSTQQGPGKKQTSMFLLYMDGVSVVNNKNNNKGTGDGAPVPGVEFSMTDCYAIQKIHAEPELFKLLVHSLCPAIFGHEIVKAGLLLGLFGGTSSGPDSRSDSHILLVGDPGLGKSQLLHACASAAPRGVFVCGNTSTSAGLTATMTRDAGERCLEAGALILASRGCCCIDEFDKMPTQHAALLEAMEQQTVSVAKAGVVCTLPARTAVLAAANPAGGHYNRGKTVAENLRMGPALLSRFDLVFILLDRPDQRLDSLLSEHVLALHSAGSVGSASMRSACSDRDTTPLDCTLANLQLVDRLKLAPGEPPLDTLPHLLLRKYIAYARTYVHPKLSTDAAQVLKTFYIELRKKHHTTDGTPVTTRQLESLIRLTQARAKLELRETATAQDAMDVVEIMRNSLIDTFSDEYGNLDFKRSQLGAGVSSRNKIKQVISILQKKAELQSSSLFSTTQLREIFQNAGCGDRFFDILNSLNVEGFLLNKGSNTYQLLTAN